MSQLPQMPPGFTWNGGQFPAMPDMANMNPMMYQNQAIMGGNQAMMGSNQPIMMGGNQAGMMGGNQPAMVGGNIPGMMGGNQTAIMSNQAGAMTGNNPSGINNNPPLPPPPQPTLQKEKDHSTSNNASSRNRSRRSRSRSGDRDRMSNRSSERRGDRKRKSDAMSNSNQSNKDIDINKSKDANATNDVTSQNMNVMNPMMMGNMMVQPGAMMPMGGGMFPANMMMGGFAPNMMPAAGMEGMTGAGMEMMGQAQLEMMNSSGNTDMSMMGGIMMDPTMMGMGMFPVMGGDDSSDKKELVLKTCKLTPPPLGTAPPPRRQRPPGCRTIFIGGLPDQITERHVKEIFERFGRVYTLRLSKKNFCHIRFDRESSVESAMALSGYRLKLLDVVDEDKETNDNAGWLHVDYALSRDDQSEYERRASREARQERRIERPRSPSPNPASARILPYSTLVVPQIAEKIRSEEHFTSALPNLIAWLERGECSKKNANAFYSMIQATNTHTRRLYLEKMQCDEDFQQQKEIYKNKFQKIIYQFEQVAKVLAAAVHQRVWDHFTKPQRKNIETWQRMSQDFQVIKDEFNEKYNDEDGDNEFDNDSNKKSDRFDNKSDNEQLKQLKEENENLQFQLEAYKNEVEVVRSDAQKEFEKFKAQFIARQALNTAKSGGLLQPPPPPPELKPPPPPPLPAESDLVDVVPKSEVNSGCGEAKLIGIMSAFLQVHPQGASLDYVVSYVRAMFPSVDQTTVHHVLQKHKDVFSKTTSGVGAGIEHRWSFCAFSSIV